MRFDNEVSASVDEVSRVPQGRKVVAYIVHTGALPHNWKGYADDIMIYAVIPRPLSCP